MTKQQYLKQLSSQFTEQITKTLQFLIYQLLKVSFIIFSTETIKTILITFNIDVGRVFTRFSNDRLQIQDGGS